MAKRNVIPRVQDEATDRAVDSLAASVARLEQSVIADGVLVEVTPGSDGTLSVPHGLKRRAKGALVVGSDRGVFKASVLDADDGAVTLGIAPEWEQLERKDAVKDETFIDFEYSPHAGLDGEYKIDGYWETALVDEVSPVLLWRVNGSTTLAEDKTLHRYYNDTTGTYADGLVICAAVSDEARSHRFESKLYVPDGDCRMAHTIDAVCIPEFTVGEVTTPASTDGSYTASAWNDTVAIASLGVETSETSSILIGSHFTLYRRPRLAGRTLNIWIF